MMRALLVVAALAGCAHGNMRGSVVMKIDDRDAHVCLGNGEVHDGSVVDLYRNDCTNARGPRLATQEDIPPDVSCTRVHVTSGRVTKVLNEHYSVVRFPAGTGFQEGDTVEAAR